MWTEPGGSGRSQLDDNSTYSLRSCRHVKVNPDPDPQLLTGLFSPPLTAAAPVRPSCSRSWTENTEWMREMKWDLMKPWPGLELVYSPELTSLSPVALDLVSCGLDMKKAVKLPFLIYILKDFTHRKMYFKCSLASLRQMQSRFHQSIVVLDLDLASCGLDVKKAVKLPFFVFSLIE